MNEYNEIFSLKNKTVLITGGASGLGFAMAKCCSLSGARVVIVGSRSENALEKACREIGENVFFERFDITNCKNTETFISHLLSRFETVDILINNAGIHSKKPFEQISEEELERVLKVHLIGAFALTKALVPHFKAKGNGNVIFVSSMAAFLEMTQVAAYASAKAAVLGLMRSLSGELSESGIRVNAVVPGFIDTPMFRKATDADPARKEKIIEHTPMKKFGTSQDVGWACVYLASAASSFVTGVSLPIDGGCRDGF